MTLPANIRANIGAPFPSLVKQSGPITIAKANGIWTVGFQIINFAQLAPGTDPTQIYVLVYNNINKTFQNITISALLSTNTPATKITSANSPYTPLATDTFLLVDTTGGPVEIDLTLAALRNNISLAIKDWKGNAAVNNITIKPSGAETVDGFTNASPLKIATNYDAVLLRPDVASYVISP